MYPNIEAERARNNLTYDELADKLGVSRKTIYTWLEKGKIPAPKLIKMADMFNCTIDYLLGRTKI
jgi:DNA-binding XRE family transcriptional regulator